MIYAAGDSSAQSKVRRGRIVHGINSIRVAMAVQILFFIFMISFRIIIFQIYFLSAAPKRTQAMASAAAVIKMAAGSHGSQSIRVSYIPSAAFPYCAMSR